MARPVLHVLCLLALAWAAPAFAGTVKIVVTDTSGKPAANAVVELVPQSHSDAASHLPDEAIIDQRDETFIPLVSLIRQGGHVIFANHDTTMHQVYSFSEIKQFAFEIDQGERSKPVVFDKAGVSSIGCNIHDQMVTFVYVAAAPWAALTDAQGRATISDVPEGAYRAKIWHPQMMPGRAPRDAVLSVGAGDTSFASTLSLLPGELGKKPKHMQMY